MTAEGRVSSLGPVIDLLEFMLTGGPQAEPLRYPKVVAAFRDAFPDEYHELMDRVMRKGTDDRPTHRTSAPP